MAWFAKRYIGLIKKEKKDHEDSIITTIQKKMDDQYKKTQNQMDECYKRLDNKVSNFIEESRKTDSQIIERIGGLQKDVLDIEGSYFRNECRKLLEEGHVITNEEFNTITIQHTAYNNLGGNHEGDALYLMVKEKHKEHLTHLNKKTEE